MWVRFANDGKNADKKVTRRRDTVRDGQLKINRILTATSIDVKIHKTAEGGPVVHSIADNATKEE